MIVPHMLYTGEVATGAAAAIYTAPLPTPGIDKSGSNVVINFVRIVNESGAAITFTLYSNISGTDRALTPIDTQLPTGSLWDDLPVFEIPKGSTLKAIASATGVSFSVNASI